MWTVAIHLLAGVLAVVSIWLLIKLRDEVSERTRAEENAEYTRDAQIRVINQLRQESKELLERNAVLEPYSKVANADVEARRLLENALEMKRRASVKAEEIIAAAKKSADEIAGNALQAKANADLYEHTATAMKNIISGYGNEYILPSHLLLDDLANTYGYTQAADDFKKARTQSKLLVKNRLAGDCDYADTNRSDTAVNFVIDAFNGKVDSILSRAKTDNFGKLKQEMIDAYHLVNFNGQAFRNARITEGYFNARMEELRLSCLLHAIRQQDIEEQRRIKEQIREEEKARREVEKALRDSAKEEEMLQKAMEKVRGQLEHAQDEQRAAYEAQIAELERKWKEAEERNKRALSMAQQTKCGHVYIISNIGSFGENVFKIGMTRRLEPLDRVRELGDASVPFSFDVHAMIWSEDAPALEAKLHKRFALSQVNKVNYRKEFFRTTLTEICDELAKDNLEIKWTMAAEAQEYRESLSIEKALANNPDAQKAWLNRQFKLEDSREQAHLSGLDEEDESEEAV